MSPENIIQKGIYKNISRKKAEGATFTPRLLADFVANEIIKAAYSIESKDIINIFDPAIGDGQLLDSLLNQLHKMGKHKINVYGFETNCTALNNAISTLSSKYPTVKLDLKLDDFITNVLEQNNPNDQIGLFGNCPCLKYDLIIANPPYVRTQILGTDQTKILAKKFGLSGRIDLYYAFIIGMSLVLQPQGTAGIIVSNRFMTTKSGASVRKEILKRYKILKVWDFGDTKLFDAAVLPAVLLLNGSNGLDKQNTLFSSIYATREKPHFKSKDLFNALATDGIAELDNGRIFKIQQGILEIDKSRDSVWCNTTPSSSYWLSTVKEHTWNTFREIGKIRVGVKTTADKVFIRSNWQDATEGNIPELLRPLITHQVARQFKAINTNSNLQILYPHEVVNGRRRSVDISLYPHSENYLLKYRKALERRDYVIEAGRKWYEIWVPQDPDAWKATKLVFRDISEKPTFWIDKSGAVINGDCYWLISDDGKDDLIWLAAAIANSTFIEKFYDYSFCNKLYAGRRRFITQYVEKFPLPDPNSEQSKKIILLAKTLYDSNDPESYSGLINQLNNLVWQAFGLTKEITG